ncbi:hypothetical protein SDC9_153854 [bioreactor metagenome]|uniref:Uncharacterized protein n=1 Tax=bioreactor metagenome TaxID=1076179 RepID=A0A645EX21_9ZZZZ
MLQILAEGSVLYKILIEQSAAHGKAPGIHAAHNIQPRLAADAAGQHAGQPAAGQKRGGQGLWVAVHIAVAQQVGAEGAGGLIPRLLRQHELGGALEDAGAFGDLAHKGHVLEAGGLDEVVDRVVEQGAHQMVEAAVHRQPGSPHAVLLGVGHHLQKGGLSGGLHEGAQLLHLLGREAHVLKAPVFHREILAGDKDLLCVFDGHVVAGEHDDDFVQHGQSFLSLPPPRRSVRVSCQSIGRGRQRAFDTARSPRHRPGRSRAWGCKCP